MLPEFFERAQKDDRIGVCHVAIYAALYYLWQYNHCVDPVSITRQQVMRLAKIKRTVYHECVKDLHEWGYVKYVPSYHPVLGSLVYLNNMNSASCDITL